MLTRMVAAVDQVRSLVQLLCVLRVSAVGGQRSFIHTRPARLQMVQDEASGQALLLPLLRALGNIAAGGGGAAMEQLLAPDAAPALQSLVTCTQVSPSGAGRSCDVLGSAR